MLTIHGGKRAIDCFLRARRDTEWTPLKIGLVTHYMPPHHGGIERVAETLFTAYMDRGFDVRWVASRDSNDAPSREGERIRVPCWNGLEGRLGVPVPLWGPSAWSEVRRLACWADVLHVHDCLYPGSVLAVTFGRSLGTPVVLSQHVGFVHYRSPALRSLEHGAYATLGRWVLRRAHRIAFATPAAEAYVTSLLGGCPSHAGPVANGIDVARFHPAGPRERAAARECLGLPREGPVVLFVGRLVEKKGVDLVAAVSRRLKDVQFLVMGDGPLAGTVRGETNIIWHRSMGHEQIHQCYHASDCFLLPSHGEGLPVAVQEAAACGLPIIVSDCEAYAGPLIDHGICLGAARATDRLAERVREVLNGAAREMGTRARRYAEANWSVSAMIANYLALIETIPTRNVRGRR
jgi:glycosyltransferase involved in cell wall biosynthesis